MVRPADDAYDAQHPSDDDPQRRPAAVERPTTRFGVPTGTAPTGTAPTGTAPASRRMTVADVAADLDVIDPPVLVESWARSVAQDWSA